MNKNTFYIHLAIMFFCFFNVSGQDNHYWSVQNGAKSSLLGGAVVASWEDNSAIFYNPGANAFINDPSISVSSDTYFFSSLNIENGAGENVDLQYNGLNSLPQIAAGVAKTYNKPDITISYGALNQGYSRIKITKNHEMLYDVLGNNPGQESYLASYNYNKLFRDDWVGLGVSKKIRDNFGIGMSMFLTFTTVDYSSGVGSGALTVDVQNQITNADANYNEFEEMEFRHIGALAKLGAAWIVSDFYFGLTVTVPRATIPLGNTNLSKSILLDIESQLPYTARVQRFDEKLKSTYKSPWIIDFGVTLAKPKSQLMLRTAYHSDIDRYNMTDSISNPSFSDIFLSRDQISLPFDERKSVFNVGLGYQRVLNESFELLMGFRTDFQFFDFSNYEEFTDFQWYYANWDIYHLSSGITWSVKDLQLTIGVSYAYGIGKDKTQVVNFTDPLEENFLLGIPDESARYRYDQLNVLIGFTYNIGKIDRNKDPENSD